VGRQRLPTPTPHDSPLQSAGCRRNVLQLFAIRTKVTRCPGRNGEGTLCTSDRLVRYVFDAGTEIRISVSIFLANHSVIVRARTHTHSRLRKTAGNRVLRFRFVGFYTARYSCGAVHCNRSCLWVCGWVCHHDNLKLRTSIFSKLGLYR